METVTIPKKDFYRMLNALEKVEPLLAQKKLDFVDADTAMQMLGCKRTKLWELASEGAIRYSNTGKGRNVRYCRKSIEQFIEANTNK